MPSTSLPYTDEEAGVCPQKTQGVSPVFRKMPVVRAQLLLGTIGNYSSRERRVAICTATDSLRRMCVRVLYPILVHTSGKCPRFLPLQGIPLASCSRELPVALTTRFPFL
jgi:hypothetical protein